MRIIGGKHRSLKLHMVPSEATRETSDMVRGAIANSLGIRLIDARVLDLFAGSGAYGLESISRGSKFAVLNDSSKIATQTIAKNVNHLKLETEVDIWNLDYSKALKKIQNEGLKFNIVYLDPPYEMNVYESIINELYDALEDDGIIVVEMHKLKSLSLESINKYTIHKQTTYGIKKVVYLKKY